MWVDVLAHTDDVYKLPNIFKLKMLDCMEMLFLSISNTETACWYVNNRIFDIKVNRISKTSIFWACFDLVPHTRTTIQSKYIKLSNRHINLFILVDDTKVNIIGKLWQFDSNIYSRIPITLDSYDSPPKSRYTTNIIATFWTIRCWY